MIIISLGQFQGYPLIKDQNSQIIVKYIEHHTRQAINLLKYKNIKSQEIKNKANRLFYKGKRNLIPSEDLISNHTQP